MENPVKKKKEFVKELREETGCTLSDARKAIQYAGDDKRLAIAYIRAISLAVATPSKSFDERVKLFYGKG